MRERETGDGGALLAEKDVAEEEGRETLGVLVMVMALLPTLMGSWPWPRSLSTSWPEVAAASCFLGAFTLWEVGDTVGEEWEDLVAGGVATGAVLPVVVGRDGVTFPFNRSFFRLS